MNNERRWKLARQWLETSNSKWLVFLADVFEAIKLIPDNSVDLIVTDMPYESLEKYRDSKRRIKEYEKKKKEGNLTGTRIPRLRDWFDIIPNSSIPLLLDEFYRVMVENSHLYMFCDDETSDVIANVVKHQWADRGKNNFTWWKRIVWDKEARGQGYHYANQHEFVIFLEKGKRKLNSFSHRSVLKCKRVRKPLRATQKPEELTDVFILNSSNPGDLVFDPFVGCGGVGISAISNDREFLGFDSDKRAVRISRERLKRTEKLKKEYGF